MENLYNLIKSIPYINIQSFKVVIAGDSYERNNLENLARNNNINNKTIFLGHIKNVRKIYKVIDILVVHSEYESFSLTILEGHAYQRRKIMDYYSSKKMKSTW
ncbi:MAG: glycosyltransferase [Methanosarcinales archaeon]|nr:glycosyltransferase [Methanosarcinales archaeon]